MPTLELMIGSYRCKSFHLVGVIVLYALAKLDFVTSMEVIVSGMKILYQ